MSEERALRDRVESLQVKVRELKARAADPLSAQRAGEAQLAEVAQTRHALEGAKVRLTDALAAAEAEHAALELAAATRTDSNRFNVFVGVFAALALIALVWGLGLRAPLGMKAALVAIPALSAGLLTFRRERALRRPRLKP